MFCNDLRHSPAGKKSEPFYNDALEKYLSEHSKITQLANPSFEEERPAFLFLDDGCMDAEFLLERMKYNVGGIALSSQQYDLFIFHGSFF